jgi:hypothetical protein
MFLRTAGSCFVATGLIVAQGSAQPIEWLSPADGSWQTPANWSGGVSPNLIAQEPTLGQVGAYTVTSSASSSHGLLTISNPGVTLRLDTTEHFLYGDVVNAGSIMLDSSSFEFRVADAAIEGAGSISLGAVSLPMFSQLIAEGVQVTNRNGHTINGNGQITIGGIGGSWRNAGTIVADDPAGPGIEVSFVVVEQTANGRTGADGGTIAFRNGSGLVGGELFVTNNGSFRIIGSAPVSLDAVTVTGRVEVDEADRTLSLDGSINLQGEITMNPSGSADGATLLFDADAAIVGSGEVIIRSGGFSQGYVRVSAGRVGTIGQSIEVRGSGFVVGEIVNNGLIVADDPAASLVLEGAFSGSGLFGADDATLFLGDAVAMSGCVFNTLGTGVIRVGENIVRLIDGRNEGQIELLPGAELRIEGVHTNNGTITQPTGNFDTELVQIRNGARVEGDGMFVFDSISFSGLSGTGGQGAIGPDQVVFGSYLLDGDLVVEGVLEPENRVEILGDVALAATAVLRMDIGDSLAASDSIELRFGNGTLTLGGTLVIQLEPGFVPQIGDQWVLIGADPGISLLGAFDDIAYPPAPIGGGYVIETGFFGLRLSVVEVCRADLADPSGVLNFFDLAAFIALFNAGDPAADFAAPFGSLNFFDVAEYVAQFNAGCP